MLSVLISIGWFGTLNACFGIQDVLKGKMDKLHLDEVFFADFSLCYYPQSKRIWLKSASNPSQPMLTCPVFDVSSLHP